MILNYNLLSIFFIIILCDCITCTEIKEIKFCKDVKDSRNETSDSITIPRELMSNNSTWNFSVSTTRLILPCEDTLTVYMDLIDNTKNTNGTIQLTSTKEKTALNRAINLRGKNGTQFTLDAYLEFNSQYYSPKEYCIARISDTELHTKICPVNCDERNTLCIPKCCGVGEVFKVWKGICVRVADETEPWSPFIYENHHNKISKKVRDSMKIHYRRPFLHCKDDTMWEKLPFSTVQRANPQPNKTSPEEGYRSMRLMQNGEIVYLDHTRKWLSIPKGEYCLDGFLNWGKAGNGSYLGGEEHQIVLLCPDPDALPSKTRVIPWISDMYAGVLYGSSVFLLLTVAVHLALFDRQNIHGLTILSQAISMFFTYTLHGTAYFVSQRRDLLKDYRSPGCLFLAISAHYFFLSTFAWLSVVNFDLWLTFRSMRPVSKVSKKIRRFRLYSAIGWGIPLLMIGIFVFLDFYYRDIESEVIVPDYGEKSCFVASWARWYYNCSILAFVIPFNVIMIASTFKIFYDFRSGNGPLTTKRMKSDKYSLKLFIKLFLVMGVIWSFELIFCWMYNGEQAPWYLVALDFAMFLQAIAVFLIFCWNRRTLKQLEEKFPKFKKAFKPVRKLLKISETLTEATESTPATPGGMRKLSTTSVLSSQGGTLDRRPSADC